MNDEVWCHGDGSSGHRRPRGGIDAEAKLVYWLLFVAAVLGGLAVGFVVGNECGCTDHHFSLMREEEF